jgi:hypothetical protein
MTDPTKPIIDDPLARFLNEEQSRNSGVKNPQTGIREEYDTMMKQKLRNDEAKRKSEVSKRIITMLMNDDLGREWLFDRLTECNVFGTPFHVDPVLSAFNAGALHFGRMLESEIKKFSIKLYGTMIEEGLNREKIWDDHAADGK